jgi:hypothetical protein
MTDPANQLRQKWIAALRSGDFKQIAGRFSDFGNGRCAIGVLRAIVPGGYACDAIRLGALTEREYDKVVLLNDKRRWTFARIANWLERSHR